MTFDWITKVFICPIVFFLSIFAFILTGLSLYASFFMNTGFILISCILFILAFNAFRTAWIMYKSSP